MALEYAKQPWQTLYVAYELFAMVILLPVWSVMYMFTRPRPTWSWTHAMIVAYIRRSTLFAYKVDMRMFMGSPDYRAIPSTTKYNVEAAWIDGVQPHLITAEFTILASVACTTPIRIPGYWYARDGTAPKPNKPVARTNQKKVLLYFHGGAFTFLSAHPKDPYAIPLFRVEYRLSSTHPLPEQHPFPAAILDALAGYIHLVEVVGYDPSNIIVAGDSAGGNLALALVRYLVENQRGSASTNIIPGLPVPPGHLLLLYPWPDLSNSHAETHMALTQPGVKHGLARSAYANDMDVVSDFFVGRGYPSYSVLAYVGPFGLGMASSNRYISPASLSPLVQARFSRFPRTLIVAGGVDRFLDQAHTLRDKMMRDMPREGQVTYYEETDGVHGFLTMPTSPGYRAAYDAIRDWLTSD
ncbi:Alpha/Beta hydrolase protein [Scleroderma yunnanense]